MVHLVTKQLPQLPM